MPLIEISFYFYLAVKCSPQNGKLLVNCDRIFFLSQGTNIFTNIVESFRKCGRPHLRKNFLFRKTLALVGTKVKMLIIKS